tara:strand:+ start:3553 stop:5202 length:1650 start_codon:yes stop_codon:yes gene_type:complete
MKVPTYTSQVGMPKTYGGGTLTAQASPGAWAAQGQALQKVGNLFFNVGQEKEKIEAQNQVNRASILLKDDIFNLTQQFEQEAALNPNQAELNYEKELQNLFKTYTSGTKTDGSGNLLLNKRAVGSFGFPAQEMISNSLIKFKENNAKRISDHAKHNVKISIKNKIRNIADMNIPIEQRLKSFNEIFNAENGIIPMAGQAGYFRGNELVTLNDQALEDVIVGTLRDAMTQPNNDDALGIVLGLAAGKSNDPLIQKILDANLLDPSKKMSIINSLKSLAGSIDEERENREKALELEALNNDKQIFSDIFKLDPIKDIDEINKLKTELYNSDTDFIDASKRNALDNFTKPEDPETEKQTKSDDKAIAHLNKLDNENLLTFDVIEEYRKENLLSDADYKSWLKEVTSEAGQGVTNAKALISSAFKYEKYKDMPSAYAAATTMQYHDSMLELRNWLDDEGKGSTYAAIIDKAKSIISSNKEDLTPIIQDQFNMEYAAIVNQLVAAGYTEDPDNRLQSVLQFLRSPEIVKQMSTNPLLLGFYREMSKFAQEEGIK